MLVAVIVAVVLSGIGLTYYLLLKESDSLKEGKGEITEVEGGGTSLGESEGSDREGADSGYEDALGSLEEGDENKGSDRGEVGVIEEGTGDTEGSSEGIKNEYEEEEAEGSKTTISRSGNTGVITSTPDSSAEVTYGDAVDIPGGGTSSGTSKDGSIAEKGNGGLGSSNDVDTEKMSTNNSVEKVKDMYDREMGLKVIPNDQGGYMAFEGDFSHSYSKVEGVFFLSDQSAYDNMTAKILVDLGVGLSEGEIKKAINRVRDTGDRVDMGKVSFYFGNKLSVRW